MSSLGQKLCVVGMIENGAGILELPQICKTIPEVCMHFSS